MNSWQEEYEAELNKQMSEMINIAEALGSKIEIQADHIVELKLVVDGQIHKKMTVNKAQSTGTRTAKRVTKGFAEKLSKLPKFTPKVSLHERINYQKMRAGMLPVPNDWVNDNLGHYALSPNIFETLARPALSKQLSTLRYKNIGRAYELVPGVTMVNNPNPPFGIITIHKHLAQKEEEFADADL